MRVGRPIARRHAWHVLGRLALLAGFGLGSAELDTPTVGLPFSLFALVLVLGTGLWFVSGRPAPLVIWLYPPVDTALLALLIHHTGGAGSPLTNLSYVWFLGALFYLRPEHAKALPLVAAASLAAVAAGTWDGTGWGLELGAHALGLGACALLGRRFLGERSQNRVDPLTRALGRRYGTEQLTAWLDAGTPFNVAFLDLHGFKEVNDRYGHGVGDEILSAVALRLGGATRPGDLVMRYGGDEFVVASRAPALTARLAAALEVPARTSVGELALRADIGEAAWRGGETLLSLLGRADAAMYRCKAATRLRGAPALQTSDQPAPDYPAPVPRS